MFALDYVLAIALLTCPAEGSDLLEEATTPEVFSAVHATLQSVAIEWEILDPREIRYVLTRPEDFASDLKLLRRRYQDLKDAPPLVDCQRFPDRSTISDLLAFNRAYRQYLDNRQSLEMVHAWEVRERAARGGPALSRLGHGTRRPVRLLLRDGPPSGAQAATRNGRRGSVLHEQLAAARASVALPAYRLNSWSPGFGRLLAVRY